MITLEQALAVIENLSASVRSLEDKIAELSTRAEHIESAVLDTAERLLHDEEVVERLEYTVGNLSYRARDKGEKR